MKQIIDEHSNYSFSDYFKFSYYTEEILNFFKYTLHKEEYCLPHSSMVLERLIEFIARFKEPLPYISLTNETTRREFLIIEAKNADLEIGFSQLAVELIALEQSTEHSTALLYGAVSTGNIWQFAILDRVQRRITQDINLLRAPADLEDLLHIIIAIVGEHSTVDKLNLQCN